MNLFEGLCKNPRLALSGGGYRATVFHLGALSYLAEEGLLEKTRFISTVSGGSLAIGLVFRANNFIWPGSDEYLEKVLPFARQLLTSTNLQMGVIIDTLSKFAILPSRAWVVSRRLRNDWGINISLRDLPESPRWIINSTSVETGRNWRFERKRMGDYVFGYSMNPDYLLSDAMAASAGYPILIGAMILNTQSHNWVRYKSGSQEETEAIEPMFDKLHLWDGGLYDNLGVEPLLNYRGGEHGFGYRNGVEYLIVSNASGAFSPLRYSFNLSTLMRLIAIPLYQSQALRSRDIIHRFQQHGFQGLYIMLGNHASYILANADINEEERSSLIQETLSEKEVNEANYFSTDIKQLSERDFDLLLRHGFETANLTSLTYTR